MAEPEPQLTDTDVAAAPPTPPPVALLHSIDVGWRHFADLIARRRTMAEREQASRRGDFPAVLEFVRWENCALEGENEAEWGASLVERLWAMPEVQRNCIESVCLEAQLAYRRPNMELAPAQRSYGNPIALCLASVVRTFYITRRLDTQSAWPSKIYVDDPTMKYDNIARKDDRVGLTET